MAGFNSTVRIFSHPVPVWVVLLVFTELALGAFSLYAGVYIRFGGDQALIAESIAGPLYPRALVFGSMIVLGMLAMGLYQIRQEPRLSSNLGRIVVGIALGALASTIIYYLLPFTFTGRGAFALSLLSALLLVCMCRYIYFAFADSSLFKTRVLVIGAGKQASTIARLVTDDDRQGFMIVGYIHTGREEISRECAGKVIAPDKLVDFVVSEAVSEIVVAMDNRRDCFPSRELLDCRLAGFEITNVTSFVEREAGKVSLEVISDGWIIFSDGFRRGPIHIVSERIFDIFTSLLLLLVMSPVMVLTAIALWLESFGREPVLYRQQRVGYKGRSFHLLKFRSMHVDAEVDGAARWASSDDPRVTFIGNIIRRFRIDELPQIINILRGDMSFVGPRPERPEFVEMLIEQIPYYNERHSVKPGLAGWAQLAYPYGASIDDARNKLQYDLYYIKNHSVILDLFILLQTLDVVIWGRGSRMEAHAGQTAGQHESQQA
ncbi:MAG: TIGR03013 family PEP-CTERM/XrtA system glycosyltransferase [Gammaproteobacteria bacterium]|jgi:sugar transferase (PEP-CTERM system associated)|nr:TIGR03013 family PEP-CTERM/XrtA system glycosyltransferase [Gammaproteobacteria bacterium]MDP6617341.1 TIGR03013 family PEP-CTERM/XrtA system glycosyltransferase [Gammaproteobacteria bacterium]MDP6694938.1 TIGR03013 family PEP-CTERM/XrtA system glycosyltransferase [Gammaproteobacteria bacterium]